MQHLTGGYRGMVLLIDVNWDRLLFPGAITLALFLAAFVGSL
ncbi:hypothetical protein [Pelagivirga sediminicola]|nr:hypothetical protein [Pelagivirga sediminicola]